MGKSQNPVESHRRKQRQKEIKKNKEKRITERDERVKQSKTVAEVTKEIKDYEKRHKHQLDQHDIKSKLDRLKKELKLVQEQDELRQKQQALLPAKNQYAHQNDTNRNFVQLERPEMSVYYDPQYNPYGAPPPGKPMLFHRYGGGVTMDIRQAIVPGEQLPTSAVQYQHHQQQQHQGGSGPPPPPPPRHNNQRPPFQGQHQQQQRHPQHQQHQQRQQAPPPPPPPLPKNQPAPPPPPPPPKEEPPKKITKDDIPNLPPPSEAVRRSQKTRRKANKGNNDLAADIWASTEEVTYEKTVHQVDLNNATATLDEPEQEEWRYLDASGNIQGPFSTEHMASWQALGYFPPSTKVKKTGQHADFLALGTLGKHVFVPSAKRNNNNNKRQQH